MHNSLNIAFVINSLASGGAERVCVNLSNYFVAQGYFVTIYIKNESKQSIYELDEGVRVKSIQYQRFRE